MKGVRNGWSQTKTQRQGRSRPGPIGIEKGWKQWPTSALVDESTGGKCNTTNESRGRGVPFSCWGTTIFEHEFSLGKTKHCSGNENMQRRWPEGAVYGHIGKKRREGVRAQDQEKMTKRHRKYCTAISFADIVSTTRWGKKTSETKNKGNAFMTLRSLHRKTVHRHR